MKTLLRVDSSPAGAGFSFSRRITDEFVAQWQTAHPGGVVITRDLSETPLEPLAAEWIAAAYTPDEGRTPRQREALALSDELISELEAADEYVIGVPMHNFSIPGTLKLWVDQVARPGKTFVYTSAGPVGLLKGKKAILAASSGGFYEPGTPHEKMDFAEPYMRTVLGFLGVTDVRTGRAGGTGKARDEESQKRILDSAKEEIGILAHTA